MAGTVSQKKNQQGWRSWNLFHAVLSWRGMDHSYSFLWYLIGFWISNFLSHKNAKFRETKKINLKFPKNFKNFSSTKFKSIIDIHSCMKKMLCSISGTKCIHILFTSLIIIMIINGKTNINNSMSPHILPACSCTRIHIYTNETNCIFLSSFIYRFINIILSFSFMDELDGGRFAWKRRKK